MKKFNCFLIMYFILIMSSIVYASEKHPIDWTKKEIAKYTYMMAGKILADYEFESAEEARQIVSTKLAVAMQILCNEGIIYKYNITATVIDKDEFKIIVKILKDFDDKEMEVNFIFNNQQEKCKTVIKG